MQKSHQLSIVSVCFGANVLSHVDRHMLIVMIDAIRLDIGLSDTQIGLLHGLAFSISFAFFTVIIARLADVYARGNLIAIAIAVWSIATGLFGFTTGFLSMFLARMGVGLGQAMLSPTVYSLLGDNFPKSMLGRASSWYASGSFIGVALVLMVGGYLADLSINNVFLSMPFASPLEPWRVGFIVAGVIGVVYAALVPVFIRDQRHSMDEDTPSFRSVLAFLQLNRQLIIRHYVGFSFSAMAMFTLIAWGPAYFMRVQEMSAATAGSVLALGFLGANITGVLFSGIAIDYLNEIGKQGAPFIVGSCAAFMTGASIVVFFLAGDGIASIVAFFLALHFSCYAIAPSATAIQVLAPSRMRARVYALFLCVNSFIGLSAGSAMVGLFNDYVFQNPMAVGTSMAITVGIAATLAASILSSGRRYYVELVEGFGSK